MKPAIINHTVARRAMENRQPFAVAVKFSFILAPGVIESIIDRRGSFSIAQTVTEMPGNADERTCNSRIAGKNRITMRAAG